MPIGTTRLPPPATGPGWTPRGAPTDPAAGPGPSGLPLTPGIGTQLLDLRRESWGASDALVGLLGASDTVAPGEVWAIHQPHMTLDFAGWAAAEAVTPILGVVTPLNDFYPVALAATGGTPLWVAGGAGATSAGAWWLLAGQRLAVIIVGPAGNLAPSGARWGAMYERHQVI